MIAALGTRAQPQPAVEIDAEDVAILLPCLHAERRRGYRAEPANDCRLSVITRVAGYRSSEVSLGVPVERNVCQRLAVACEAAVRSNRAPQAHVCQNSGVKSDGGRTRRCAVHVVVVNMEVTMLKSKPTPNRKKLVLEKLPVVRLVEEKREGSAQTSPDAATAIARYSTKTTCEGGICA